MGNRKSGTVRKAAANARAKKTRTSRRTERCRPVRSREDPGSVGDPFGEADRKACITPSRSVFLIDLWYQYHTSGRYCFPTDRFDLVISAEYRNGNPQTSDDSKKKSAPEKGGPACIRSRARSDSIEGQRANHVRDGGTMPHLAPGVARKTRTDRSKASLRSRHLWRLYGNRGREARVCLLDARHRFAGPGNYDGRIARRKWRTRSIAAGVRGSGRVAMRLLHVRVCHVCEGISGREFRAHSGRH